MGDDSDNDGLLDGAEDTNFDGLILGDLNFNRVLEPGEPWTETDPINEDSDQDGLIDPADADTDNDLLSDGLEDAPRAVFVYSERTGMIIDERSYTNVTPSLRSADPDGDGLTDYEEMLLGSHPYNRDTDGDGFLDGVDGNPVGVENLAPSISWNSWADNLSIGWQGPQITFHLEVTGSDSAGLSKIQVEGTTWTFNNSPNNETRTYSQTVVRSRSGSPTFTMPFSIS